MDTLCFLVLGLGCVGHIGVLGGFVGELTGVVMAWLHGDGWEG